MDPFSYLSVLLSIIIGLAITQILKGFRGMLLSRARIRMYWPVLWWSILLLAMFVQSWWSMFGLRNVEDWTFQAFSIVLLQTIIEYMLAALVFPDFFGTETIDLRVHYFEHLGWFFGLMIAVLAVSLSKDLVLSGHMTNPMNVRFHAFFIIFSLTAILVRRDWYHQALPAIGVLGFCAYVLLLFSRLR
jgi:hypothetical protein